MKKLILSFLLVMAPFAAFSQYPDEAPDDTQVEESSVEREPSADKKDSANAAQKARYRLYAGGQDEQDLQVQASLPVPQRYNDGQAPVIKTTGEE